MLMSFIQKNYNKQYIKFINDLFYPPNNSWSLKNTLIESCRNKTMLTKGDIFWPMKEFAEEVIFNQVESGYSGQILPHFTEEKKILPFISILFHVSFENNNSSLELLGHMIYEGLKITDKILDNDNPSFIVVPHNTRTNHMKLLKENLISSRKFTYEGDKEWFEKIIDEHNEHE